MNETKQLGFKGEEIIARWLAKKGYTILQKNFYTRYGEIDIIAQKDDVLAFVEVKTRKARYFPISTVVTRSKQRKIIATAKRYVLRHKIVDRVLRFDIATLILSETSHEINYIRNAFTE